MTYEYLELEIDVTQEDINKSLELLKLMREKDTASLIYNCICPLAVSLERTLNKKVYVGSLFLRIDDGYGYSLTPELTQIIRDFDWIKEMKPFKGKYKLSIINF